MTSRFSLFALAARNIRRKPLRTVMLVAAISLLAASLVFGLSFTQRVRSSIRVATARLGADVIVVPAGSRGAADDILLENAVKTVYMDRSMIGKIRAVKGVKAVTPQTYLKSLTGLCCDVPETTIVAFDQETDFIVTPWLSKKIGRRLQKGEAVVGSESAMNISLELTEVDTTLFGAKFHMVGVLEKTGTGLDTAMFISEENVGDILTKGMSGLRPDQISLLFVKVEEGLDPYTVAVEIENNIVQVDAVARKDVGQGILSTLRDINSIFIVTVVLVSLLSVFLVWTVFSAIANERSREIGIMRAIGARDSHVVRIFLFEVLVIGIVGSLLGIVLGTLSSILLSKGFVLLKSLPTDLAVSQRIAIGLVSGIAGTAICVIGAVSPIRRMKRLEPLVVIKEE